MSSRLAIGCILAFALGLSPAVLVCSTRAQAGPTSTWRGTILCTRAVRGGYRSLAVGERGRLTQLTLGRAVSPGLRVQLQGASASTDGRFLSARKIGAVRLLGHAREPFVVRAELIENSSSSYDFYRNGRPWGCPVAFGDAAAVSVTRLILSSRRGPVTLAVRHGRLVHVGPQEASLAAPAREAQARRDLAGFVALLARGDSIAACATLSDDALLIHGGRDGCIMDFESAKFLYRDRYAGARVEGVALFDLGGRSYAVGTIERRAGTARAILVHERGRYRYLGDFELSPIELW